MLPADARKRTLMPEGRAARRASVDLALVNQPGAFASRDDPSGELNKMYGDASLMAGRFEEVSGHLNSSSQFHTEELMNYLLLNMIEL